MNKGEFVWHKQWINNYISNWCIFERFKYSNTLNNKNLLFIFGNERVQALKNVSHAGVYLRSLTSLSGLDEKKTLEILGINLISRNNLNSKLFTPILGTHYSVENVTKTSLYYCPICIKSGFHSVFHQLSLFNYCVFHPGVALKDNCENCGEVVQNYSLINDDNPPFKCNCGYNFLSTNNVIFLFKEWEKNQSIKDKNLLKLLNIYKNQDVVTVK